MAETSGWAIDGPVKTPVEDARRLTYGLSGDAHGVASLSDLITRPTSPTGGAVQVSPGSCLIKSRYSDGQTYLASLNEATTLSVTPTPANVGRTDLVVFEVLDPWAQNSPVPEPADPDTFEFFKLHIIEGVAGNLSVKHLHEVPGYANRTGLVLDRITIPANRGDVQQTMIQRIAALHSPKRMEATFARPRISSDEGVQTALAANTADGGEFFPGGAGIPNQFQVLVPVWATRMIVDARWMSLTYAASRDPRGSFWMEFGTEYRAGTWPNKQQFEFSTERFAFNSPGANNELTANWLLMDEVAIPPKLRGQLVTFTFKAGLEYNGGGSGSVRMRHYGGLGCRLTFAEQGLAADLL